MAFFVVKLEMKFLNDDTIKNDNNKNLKLGSLFDGIGVFPIAASLYRIQSIWASEIEKAPIFITKRHFPSTHHLGDIAKVKGGEIPPVHILTFGSPCQNLSNIGKREGLAGSQSSLFYHAIRIIEEMRCATNGTYPVIAVWENVMGAFSSNNRLDFKAGWSRSQKPVFQCLLLESEQTLEWFEGIKLMCAGDCWMPDIEESPHSLKEEDVSSSWQILEEQVPEKYYLKPAICNRFLRLAERAGCPPPAPVEYLLKKQGGKYPSSAPFKKDACEVPQKSKTKQGSTEVLDGHMTLFQLCLQDP